MDSVNISKTKHSTIGESFLDLDRIHEGLDEIFLGHQEALILQDIRIAAELLDDYESGIRTHMHYEEQSLLPIYEMQCHEISKKGFDVEIYVLEHKKILTMLTHIQTQMRKLILHGFCGTATRKMIALLDQEAVFKHLVQHHNLREHDVLYPSLDRMISAKDRQKLMKNTGVPTLPR